MADNELSTDTQSSSAGESTAVGVPRRSFMAALGAALRTATIPTPPLPLLPTGQVAVPKSILEGLLISHAERIRDDIISLDQAAQQAVQEWSTIATNVGIDYQYSYTATGLGIRHGGANRDFPEEAKQELKALDSATKKMATDLQELKQVADFASQSGITLNVSDFSSGAERKTSESYLPKDEREQGLRRAAAAGKLQQAIAEIAQIPRRLYSLEISCAHGTIKHVNFDHIGCGRDRVWHNILAHPQVQALFEETHKRNRFKGDEPPLIADEMERLSPILRELAVQQWLDYCAGIASRELFDKYEVQFRTADKVRKRGDLSTEDTHRNQVTKKLWPDCRSQLAEALVPKMPSASNLSVAALAVGLAVAAQAGDSASTGAPAELLVTESETPPKAPLAIEHQQPVVSFADKINQRHPAHTVEGRRSPSASGQHIK